MAKKAKKQEVDEIRDDEFEFDEDFDVSARIELRFAREARNVYFN